MKRFAVILVLAGSLLFSQMAAADLMITNGGFEASNFSGWTTSGDWDSSGIGTGYTQYTHSGAYFASLGPLGNLAFLSQTITTTPGTVYDISFWLYCQPTGGYPDVFGMDWNGGTYFYQRNNPGQGYTEYSFTVQATAYTTELLFAARNDSGHWFLDDVSVNLDTSGNQLSTILPAISNPDPIGGIYGPVPLPPSALFLGSGLLVLVGWRRFRKG